MRILLTWACGALLFVGCGSTSSVEDNLGANLSTTTGATESTTTPATAGEPAKADPSGPQRAVKNLLSSANLGDPLGVLAALDPAEREPLAQLYASMVDGIERDWPHVEVASAVPALDPAIEAGRLEVELMSPDLAWVSTDAISLFLDDPAVLAYFTTYDGQWYPSDTIELDDIDLGGNEDVDPGLMAVRIDGEWRVSLARTFAELIRRTNELPERYAETRNELGAGASTPLAAVSDFVDALATADTDTIRRAITPQESSSFGDVDAALGDLVADMTSTAAWSVRAGDLTLVSDADGRATVEVSRLDMSLRGEWESRSASGEIIDGGGDHILTIDESCGTLIWGADEWSGCADPEGGPQGMAFAGAHHDLGWNGPRIAAVQVDGSWFVSIYETLQLVAAPLAAEPLFMLLDFPWWEAPGGWVAMDEAARSLVPIDAGEQGMLTPMAAGRIQVARVRTGPAGGRIVVDVPGASASDCELGVWLHELVSQDIDEGDDFREWVGCGESVDVPGDATLVVQIDRGLYYGGAPRIDGIATVWNDS